MSNPLTPDMKRNRQRLGMWLKGLRNARQMTQKDVAQHMGWAYYTFVSQLETGYTMLPDGDWTRLAKLYDIPADQFAKKMIAFSKPEVFACLFGRPVRKADLSTAPESRID